MSENEKPLVSFALIAYNEECFVEEAVIGALSQTYSPLEIILSDDCSTDTTFEIMEKVAQAYRGEHRVIMNRNNGNLGIGAHVNRIMEFAKGKYIVSAAGDDISDPDRVARTVAQFLSSTGHTMEVFSDCIEIDEYGNEHGEVSARPPERFTELPEMCRNMFSGVTGATTAWHRSVFDAFGPMHQNIVFEDRVIAFRAAMLGDIHYIPEALVQYRLHGANTVNMFLSTSDAAMRTRLECFRDVYLNNMDDMETMAKKGRISSDTVETCGAIMRRELRKLNGYLRILDGGMISVVSGILQVILNGGNPVRFVRLRFND